MQNRLAVGRGVRILDPKNRGGLNEPPPPASLRVKLQRQLLRIREMKRQ